MKTLGFTLQNAFARIFHQRLLSGIVVLTVAVGMLFPLATFAMTNSMLETIQNPAYRDMEHTAVLDFFAPCTDEKSVTANLQSLSPDIDRLGFGAIYQTTLAWKDLKVATIVNGCTNNYLDTSSCMLVNGRLPTPEEFTSGAKVCLIRQSDRLDNAGAQIGDTLSIAGTDFQVIGTIHMRAYGGVWIPYNSLEPIAGKAKLQFDTLLHTQGAPNTATLETALKTIQNANVISVQSAVGAQRQIAASVEASIRKQLLIGLAVLLFAVVSFVLVVAGKTLDEQYVTAVKMAVGATKRQVFADLFTENAVLITTAVLIDFLVFPLAARVMSDFTLLLDWEVVLITICVGLLLALIVTFIVTILFLRKNVSELLRKRL